MGKTNKNRAGYKGELGGGGKKGVRLGEPNKTLQRKGLT